MYNNFNQNYQEFGEKNYNVILKLVWKNKCLREAKIIQKKKTSEGGGTLPL